MANRVWTKKEAEEKVYQYTEQLIDIQKQKKDSNAQYTSQIKDIEAEIEAIIEEQNKQNTAGTAKAE